MDSHLDRETAQNIQDRLARIDGQVRGIMKMVDEGRRCDQIVMQVMAARAALEKVATAVVAASIDDCLALPPDQAKKVISDSINLLTQL